MVETIFTNPIFVETVLPFLLMFTLVFAVLQKTEILGKGKKQIDALVALVVGLLFVAFGVATDIVVRMIPILGIALVVILTFMLLVGFTFQGKLELPKGVKITLGALIALLVAVSVLFLTGGLDYLLDFVYGNNSGLFMNAVLVVIVLGVIALVVFWKEKGGGGDKEVK